MIWSFTGFSLVSQGKVPNLDNKIKLLTNITGLCAACSTEAGGKKIKPLMLPRLRHRQLIS